MPVACLFAHDPEPRTAMVLDGITYASCRRCGAGLIDRGAGWASPLPRRTVLLRPTMPEARTRTMRPGLGLAPEP